MNKILYKNYSTITHPLLTLLLESQEQINAPQLAELEAFLVDKAKPQRQLTQKVAFATLFYIHNSENSGLPPYYPTV